MRILAIFLAACLLGCSTMAYHLEPVTEIEIALQPGDEEMVQVSVGSLRKALGAYEAYKALIVYHNEVIGETNEISDELAVVKASLAPVALGCFALGALLTTVISAF